MNATAINLLLLSGGIAFICTHACKSSDSPPDIPPGRAVNGLGTGTGQNPFVENKFGTTNGLNTFPAAGANVTQFAGTWRSTCVPDKSGGASSLTQEWQISGNRYVVTFQKFADRICALADFKQTRSGTFMVVSGGTSSPSPSTSSMSTASAASPLPVNYTVDNESTLLLNPAAAQAWNDQNFCKANNWAANISYNTLVCQNTRTVYDLWRVQTTPTPSFTVGLTDDSHRASTESGRPTTLDQSMIMQRPQG